jgi:N-glycosylase/DNA lyase
MNLAELLSLWKAMHAQLREHLARFEKAGQKRGPDLFAELAFCLFTPQSKAFSCWAAIEELKEKRLLMLGSAEQIAPLISAKGVRFKNNKARYLVEARGKLFSKGFKPLHRLIASFESPQLAREWLVNNIKGLGLKEASHFLRNIGRGADIAILDRHILKNLQRLGVIKTVPSTLSEKTYLNIEKQMKAFSRKIKIPMDCLDLLLWYNETGALFK